jgi:hypothetical protein
LVLNKTEKRFGAVDGHYVRADDLADGEAGLDGPKLFAGAECLGGAGKDHRRAQGEFPALRCQWHQLSVVAHNLIRIQLDTFAEPRPRSRKRSYTYLIRSMRTRRFLVITRAGRLTRIAATATSCARLTIPPRRRSMRRSIAARPPELFSDWG